MRPTVDTWRTAGSDKPWLPGLAFAGVAAFYLFLGVHEGVPGIVADDAIYLLMADTWSPYNPDLAQSAAFVTEHIRFPPLYPILLALLGGNSNHLAVAHLVTVVFLLASLVIYFLWLRRELGNGLPALLLTLAFAVLPTTQIHALDLWSEHLYLLLSLCALALPRNQAVRDWMIVAVLVSAAALTRTAGITLVAAFVASAWLTPAPRRLWPITTALVPVAAWAILNSFDTTDDQNISFLFSKYGAAGIDAAWQLIAGNAQALWHGWRTSFDVVDTTYGLALALLCAGSWIAGWLMRIRQVHFDAIYVLVYFGIILIWPNDDHAVALFQCMSFVTRLPEFGARATRHLYSGGFAILIIFAAAPSNAAMGARLFAPMPAEISEFRHTRLWLSHVNADAAAHNLLMINLAIRSYRIAAQYVPPGACVFSVFPEMFMYHVRRSSYAPPKPTVPETEFRNRIRRCRYVHLLWMNTHPYLAPGYPGDRIDRDVVLYKTRWKVADRVATYAELIDLGRGRASRGDLRRKEETAAPPVRNTDLALRPGKSGAVVKGEATCTAACP